MINFLFLIPSITCQELKEAIIILIMCFVGPTIHVLLTANFFVFYDSCASEFYCNPKI